MAFLEELWLLAKVSRIPAWCFGPILYTIGVIHSRSIPKTIPQLLQTGVQLFCLSFPLCIIVFGINDVYDYASDLRNPRKQGNSLEGTVLLPQHHALVLSAARCSTVLVLGSSLIPLLTTSNDLPSYQPFQSFLFAIHLLYLSWVYSSPPLRLKEIPLLDSLSNGAIVWLCWAIGYVSGGSVLIGPEATASIHKGWLLAFCTAGVHALGAAADVESDTAAGQRTIATVLGKRGAAIFSTLAYLIASTTVERGSFVVVYAFVGAAISFVPVIFPAWSHLTFQTIVYVSVLSAAGWILERAWSIIYH